MFQVQSGLSSPLGQLAVPWRCTLLALTRYSFFSSGVISLEGRRIPWRLGASRTEETESTWPMMSFDHRKGWKKQGPTV